MGCFNYIEIPCPWCGAIYEDQSKAGSCEMDHISIHEATPAEQADVANYDRTKTCAECGKTFHVQLITMCNVIRGDDRRR
jgi:hypothetical protein